MNWLHKVQLRFRALFQKETLDAQMNDEMRSHIEMQTQENMEAGMEPEEARYAALRQFGRVESIKETCRDQRGLPWLETLWQDIRYGARQLRKNPGFTAVAVLTLALGIGANTAIFSAVDVALLKSLPVRSPEQLYLLAHAGERGVTEVNNFPFYEYVRDQNQSFAGVLAFNPNRWKVILDGETEIAAGQAVTGNYFNVLGVNPLLGRLFSADDDNVPQGHPVAVISHGYWQRRFGKDPAVVGKTITINLTPFTIIGVTPPEFFGLQAGRSVEISVPMAMHSLVGSGAKLSERKFWWNLPILARLKPDVTPEQARTELDLLQQQFLDDIAMNPEARKDFFTRGELMSAQRGLAELRRHFSSPLRVLMVIVGSVLLIACANVANLLLARATARQREISIRLAIGASRMRLVRQLLTESVLLALLGGIVGLLFAYGGAQILFGFIPPGGAPLTLRFSPDVRILGFTAAVSLLTGILFGLVPAWRAARVQLNAALKDKARQASGGPARLGFGKTLIVSQIALSLLLLIGAGLFVRSLQKLRQVETGFHNGDQVLLFWIDCYGTTYQGPKLPVLHQELLERMNALPGVRSASLSTAAPLRGGMDATHLFVSGAEPRADHQEINVCVVAPRYFETLGMPLVAGRDFSPQDDHQAPRVAVVSESIARRYFPNENPLGRRFSLTKQVPEEEREIIGVVEDARFDGLRKENTPMVYLSHQQDWTRPSILFALRTTGDPAALMGAVRQTIQSVGRDIPAKIQTLAAQADETLAKERLVATLSGFFGVLALLLACIGLFGLISYAVARRTQEIGVRLALGAQRRDVSRLVMGESMRLVVLGIGIGLATALALTRLISNWLFGLTPNDPVTLALATLLLTAVAALAGYLPARRAAKVDPMVALRSE